MVVHDKAPLAIRIMLYRLYLIYLWHTRYLQYRKIKYVVWARTRNDRPDRQFDKFVNRVHAINVEMREARKEPETLNIGRVSMPLGATWVDAEGITWRKDRFGVEQIGASDVVYN